MTGSDVHDMSYYKKCMMGGILSCGITHTIVCPLDIVKCRMQVSLEDKYFEPQVDDDYGTLILNEDADNFIINWSKLMSDPYLTYVSYRLIQVFTLPSEMVSDKSKLPKDSRVSPS
jgi:hypothetical protein